MSRRRALRLGGGGALALVIGAAAGWADRRDGEGTESTPTTTSSTTTSTTTTTTAAPIEVGDLGPIDPGIVALGERVVAGTGEDDLQALLGLLPLTTDDGTTGDPLLQAALVTQREFEAGDTVAIDGWVLAVSEARAAAVVALLCRDAGC